MTKTKDFLIHLIICLVIICIVYIWQANPPKGESGNQRQISKHSQSVAPVHSYLMKEFGDEYEIIMAAAIRNGCKGDNQFILFAIRKEENGPPGLEFGILCQAGTDMNTQAGWAAATIMKNRSRWYAINARGDFIEFLGKRYCPNNSEVWISNVKFWFNKIKAYEQ